MRTAPIASTIRPAASPPAAAPATPTNTAVAARVALPVVVSTSHGIGDGQDDVPAQRHGVRQHQQRQRPRDMVPSCVTTVAPAAGSGSNTCCATIDNPTCVQQRPVLTPRDPLATAVECRRRREYGRAVRPELDLRLLRAFVAVAEELHFTRAASRLFVAQQALSRDIRRLESQLGVRLFVRSTRSVTLTADGERLLVHARGLLALNDAALRDLARRRPPAAGRRHRRGPHRCPHRRRRRRAAPQHEFTVRYGGGLGAALPQLLAGRLDVAFGRPRASPRPFPAELTRRLVRYEPLGAAAPRRRSPGRAGRDPDGAAARRGDRRQQRQRGRARVGRPRGRACSTPSAPGPRRRTRTSSAPTRRRATCGRTACRS